MKGRLAGVFFIGLFVLWGWMSAYAAGGDLAPPSSEGTYEKVDISTVPKDYYPLGPPKKSAQFFPDEVERLVSRAIIAGYLGRSWAIESYYRALLRHDLKLIRSGKSPTGLADDLFQFRNSHIEDPTLYREAQKKALKQKGLSKELRRVITYRLKNAELARAERLIHEAQLDKVSLVINGFFRSLDLLGLTMGSVVGSTVDAAIHTFVNLERLREMSPKERKALARYRDYLAKHPTGPEADKVREKVKRLEAKRRLSEYREAMREAKEHLEAGRLEEARAFYSRALELRPGDRDAREGMRKVKRLLARYEKARRRSLEVARTGVRPKDRVEEAAYRWLLEAVADGDQEAVELRAREFMARFPESLLRDEAAYSLASSLAARGKLEEARKLLRSISRKYAEGNMGRRARFVLASREFDRLRAFHEARREHRVKQIRYALLGEDFARQNIDMGLSRLFIEGIKSVETLGMVNLLGAAIRTTEVVSRDPIPNDPIIEEGFKFLRQNPNAPEVKEVYYQVAKAYEREQKYIDALTYYRLSGKASMKKLSSLRGKAAGAILAHATMAPSQALKARLYRVIIEQFPETKAASKAKERLVALVKQAGSRFRLSKQFLLEHPEIAGPEGLNIDPGLLDGDLSNREIHKKGVALLRNNRLRVFFETADGTEEKRDFRVHPEVVARLESQLRELRRKRAYLLAEKYDLEGPVVGPWEPFGGTVAEERLYNPFLSREIYDVSGNVYLSEEEVARYEETVRARLAADLSSDLSDLTTGGALYFRRYGTGLQFGIDRESPNLGLLLPLGPIDITTSLRSTGVSVYPAIRSERQSVPDSELYK